MYEGVCYANGVKDSTTSNGLYFVEKIEMKLIKLGYYFEAFNNESINTLFYDIEKMFNDKIFEVDEVVCHYFPKSALLGIVKDKKFYFSDTDFLNDSSEMKHIYSIIEKAVSLFNTDSVAVKLFKDILRIKSIIADDISFSERKDDDENDGFIYNRRNYVFCCSLDNDCLSNWKYYGKGNGYDAYNISFKASSYLAYIKSILKFKEKKCLSGIVIYDNKSKLELIINLIQKIDEFIEKSNLDSDLDSNMMRALKTRLFYYIMDISLFFKDVAYKDEKEYRFVISLDNSKIKNNVLEYDFRFVNDILVPYLKIPFDKDMIELIGIGPCMNSDLSSRSLFALLQYYDFKNTFVGESSIPLRY